MSAYFYNTLGTSRQTAFELVGLDINDEMEKRKAEKEAGMDEIFQPYGTSYTKSSDSNTDTNNDSQPGAPSNKEKGKDDGGKGEYDKERNDTLE